MNRRRTRPARIACSFGPSVSRPTTLLGSRFLHLFLKKCVYGPLVGRHDSIPKLQLQDFKDDIPIRDMRDYHFGVTGLPRHEALPRHVAFKGDNGKYLGTTHVMATIWEKVGKVLDGFGLLEKLLHEKPAEDALRNEFGHLHLQFHTEDKGDAGVIFTTFTRDDGTVRILSNLNGFWKRGSDSDDWVSVAHIKDPLRDNDPDTLFEVVTGDGFIALRNLGNKKFCKRLDADGVSLRLPQCFRREHIPMRKVDGGRAS
ncbi:uncharacterized protein LOC119324968 [Triticum dicoccoides]|uniref:uncharacterized protein LOC119324968 n=1 Tax=Triticum dicoccoides TaxID=85692 RepID=UPI0018914728|nr:uncharacterized protein LOC119324968 [Triticum dicoccoides]